MGTITQQQFAQAFGKVANQAPLSTVNYRHRPGSATNDDDAISRYLAAEAVLVAEKTAAEAAEEFRVSIGIVRSVVRAIRQHLP